MICVYTVIHYYVQVFLKILEINILKYMSLIQFIFICSRISMASMFKKDVELERLTVIDMLLIIEKGIREGICHAIH